MTKKKKSTKWTKRARLSFERAVMTKYSKKYSSVGKTTRKFARNMSYWVRGKKA